MCSSTTNSGPLFVPRRCWPFCFRISDTNSCFWGSALHRSSKLWWAEIASPRVAVPHTGFPGAQVVAWTAPCRAISLFDLNLITSVFALLMARRIRLGLIWHRLSLLKPVEAPRVLNDLCAFCRCFCKGPRRGCCRHLVGFKGANELLSVSFPKSADEVEQQVRAKERATSMCMDKGARQSDFKERRLWFKTLGRASIRKTTVQSIAITLLT